MGVSAISVIGAAADVADLPGGPLFDRMVLEHPWPTAVGVAALGIAAMVVMTGMGKVGRGRVVAAIGVAGAIAVVVAGTLVQTTREALVARTRAFVDAAAAGSADEVAEMVEEKVALRSGGDRVDGDRELIVGVSRALPGAIADHSVRMRGAQVQGANVARTRMTVRARATSGVGLTGEVYSSWEIAWRKGADDAWRVAALDCLSVFGQQPGDEWVSVARQLARRSGE